MVHAALATADMAGMHVVCPCVCCDRFLLKELAITSSIQTCFSTRLLTRLLEAISTTEALMNVAFKWETACRVALATIQDAFWPSYQWFRVKYLVDSKLVKLLLDGNSVLLTDEAFTIHPLLVCMLFALLEEHFAMLLFVGEALQINAMQEMIMLEKGWHAGFAFNMEPWRRLESKGRLLYFQLQHNFRLPPYQAQMLRRVRLSSGVGWVTRMGGGYK
jgi:hypothetical protein